MRCSVLFRSLVLGLAIAGVARADDPAKPKTGGFTTQFTTPSPLTNRKLVEERFGMTERSQRQDYNLASEKFWVYVPSSYDPAKPPGLFVFQEEGCLVVTPDIEQVGPMCDQRNIIFLMPLTGKTWGFRTAMTIDAVESLKHQYQIDPKRTYVYGVGLVAQRLTFGYPEIFSGGAYYVFRNWEPRSYPWESGKSMAAEDSFPAQKYRDIAKRYPLVLLRFTDPDRETEATADAASRAATRKKVVDYYNAHKHDKPKSWTPPKKDKDGNDIEEPKQGIRALSIGDRVILEYEEELQMLPREGFKDVRRLELSRKLTRAEKFAAMIDTLDAPPANPPAAPAKAAAATPAAPAEKPTSTEKASQASTGSTSVPKPADDPAAAATRMLNLARSYHSSGKIELAREKLETLLKQFPSTPAAVDAKKLLGQLKDK